MRRKVLVENLYRASQFFAAVFVILLVISAIALARGDEKDASQAAIYAYYSLIASVLLLLAAIALEERSKKTSERARRRQVAKTAKTQT